ncbi:MAG: Crp/Fnr family transcriptional regulator [Candidatus Zixiibacteriota bacterium]|nr:MAG: Crp/Fnr family transcriptional regulator [candidate division Zixibacteria bacterium]
MGTENKEKISRAVIACPLFSGLQKKELEEIIQIADLKHISGGQLLFSEGDPANYFYITATGKLRIYKLSSSGREQTLMTPKPGTSIGEAALFADGAYPAYAEAQSDAELVSIEKNRFLELLKSRPRLAVNMIALLSQRLKNFAHKIEQLSLMGVVPRLAEYIIQNSDGKTEFRLEISKADLASLLGTVPETLSRAFAKLKAGGYISETGNAINIDDPEGLREIASSYD